jgi:uncharacterized protein Yka (UPF0111/DUF47 family)
MISFQRLLGREEKFFGLLEASANECLVSIEALRRILSRPGEKPSLEEFISARRRDKEVTQKLEEMLIHTFVTPIEREDLEELAEKLYKIPKTVEKFAERYALVVERVADVPFEVHAEALAKGMELLLQMVRALRAGDIVAIKGKQSELRQLARNAETRLAESIALLYKPNVDPLKAIIVKDFYVLIEKTLERCREAAAVIAHILLKNS